MRDCVTLKLSSGRMVHSERVWKRNVSFEKYFTVIELDVKFGMVQKQF